MSAALTEEQRTVHFLNRTSFGPTRETIARVKEIGIGAYLKEQLTPERIADAFVEKRIAGLKTMRLSSRELIELYPPPRQGNAQNMAMAPLQGPRLVIAELQLARLLRAVFSRRQLYELMVDFWSNHFNIFAAKGADRWLVTSFDRDTIRPNALGKFRDLLYATAKSPAMLFYLDNWLSVSPDTALARRLPNTIRRGINENYARELMELHTLGVDGGYSQKDVHEVARCFTGWTIRRPRGEAEFTFEPRLHDNGTKTVLGMRIAAGGMEDGHQVIDLLARHPSTGRFIATKLARRLVADDPPPAIVSKAAETFHQSDGDISAVIQTIVESPEFISPEAFRSKVKKPLEYVASALRLSGAETEITHQLLRYLARMGEPLFLAQPPTGYPDVASSWVSPDMLLTRINFANDLAHNWLAGSRVRTESLGSPLALAGLVAPDALSASTRAALAQTDGREALALLLAAPEFHRR